MSRWLAICVAASLGAILLSVSFPQLRSSIVYMPVESALRNHWRSEPIDRERFPGLMNAAQRSIDIFADCRYKDGLAWLSYLYADSHGLRTPDGRETLTGAKDAFQDALTCSPGSSRNWLQLAWINTLVRDGQADFTHVIDAWRMSVILGRSERHLYVNRVELGLRYADVLDHEDLALLRDQLLRAWTYRRRRLINSTAWTPSHWDTIRGLLRVESPEVLQEMESAHERHR